MLCRSVTSLEVWYFDMSYTELLVGALRSMPALSSLTFVSHYPQHQLLANWDETMARSLRHLTVRST